VRPIFFVPSDQKFPTHRQQQKLADLIVFAQTEYEHVLGQNKTFNTFLYDNHVTAVLGKGPMSDYRRGPNGQESKRDFVKETLDYVGVNRYNSPYNFIFIMVTGTWDRNDFDSGAGTSINGGLNTGMGFAYLNPGWLEFINAPKEAGTLLHEMGHSFGLTHPDAYGKDLTADP